MKLKNLFIAAGLLTVASSANAVSIFGLNRGYEGGGIYSIDPNSGVTSLLYSTPSLKTTMEGNGLAFDATKSEFYYATDGSNPNLYRRTASGEVFVGKLTGGIVYNATFYKGSYYYVGNNTNTLYKVSFKPSGQIDTISSISMGSGVPKAGYGDIAFDNSGNLFGSSDKGFWKYNGSGSVLKSNNTMMQLGFAGPLLFGIQSGTDKIYSINTSNGSETYLNSLDNKKLFIQDAASTVLTDVPEPGTVALLIGMGVSGAALLARRRRNK